MATVAGWQERGEHAWHLILARRVCANTLEHAVELSPADQAVTIAIEQVECLAQLLRVHAHRALRCAARAGARPGRSAGRAERRFGLGAPREYSFTSVNSESGQNSELSARLATNRGALFWHFCACAQPTLNHPRILGAQLLCAAARARAATLPARGRPPEICAVAQPDAVLTRSPVVFRCNRSSHPPSTDSRPSGNRPKGDSKAAAVAVMNAEKLAKMAAQVRTGGKGSVRRKKKAIHKTTTTDDKRLQNTLKRLGVNNIPAIEEVNLFKDNGTVIHFNNPKVQASIAANTYVVSGHAETKSTPPPRLET